MAVIVDDQYSSAIKTREEMHKLMSRGVIPVGIQPEKS